MCKCQEEEKIMSMNDEKSDGGYFEKIIIIQKTIQINIIERILKIKF